MKFLDKVLLFLLGLLLADLAYTLGLLVWEVSR